MRRASTIALALAALFCFRAEAAKPADGGEEARLLGNVRQLTFEGKRSGEGYHGAAGRSMIFQSERHPGNPFYQMYLLDLETGETRRLSPGQGKTTCGWIHPGGAKVMFSSTQDDPEAGAKQKAELDFRASGKKRRYSWDFDENFEIYDFDLKAATYRNLTQAPGYDAEGSYSPDGTQIAFASNRHAYQAPLTEKEARIFERDKSFMMDIYIMNADGSNGRRLTTAPGYDGGPFFSADGKKIVWRRFAENGATAEIFTMNTDGSEPKRITRLEAMSWAPFFHPSGDYILFATNSQGFANFELYIVDSEGRHDPVRVTYTDGFDGLPAFSPDGGRLTWTSGRSAGGASQIFIADWNDAEARRRLGLADGIGGQGTAGFEPAGTRQPISANGIRRHVVSLASEAMGGRLTGSKGGRMATDYVAAAFRSLGLEPAGEDGGFFQIFAFTAGASLGEANRLTVAAADGGGDLALDEDWRPLAFASSGETAAAEVVFAGYGIVAPAEGGGKGYDSYAGLDVAGKWVMVLRFLPENIDGGETTRLLRYSDLPYKASVARRKGAVGLVVVSGPNSKVKKELVRLTSDPGGGVFGIAAVSISDRVAAQLLGHAGRDLKTLQEALDGGEALVGFPIPGVKLGGRVDIKREKRQGRNVLARLGTEAAAPMLVIGAHVDHLGRGEISGSLAREDERGRVHFGADDNASGVAGLIEIARYFAALKDEGRLEVKRDILFAAWSGEEMGLLGSGHFVTELANSGGGDSIRPAVAAYLNMDMIGRLEKNLILQGTGSSPVWAGQIERHNVPIGLAIVTSQDSYLSTDATSFYLKGVPALNAFTGPHKDQSTPRDSAEKINYPGAAQVARLLAGIALSLAASETAPRYVRQGRPKGSIGRRRIRVYLGTIPDYVGDGTEGVKISGIAKGSPAEKAGLRGGDVIVELAGTGIENIYDFIGIMNGLRAGKAASMVVIRQGRKVELTVTPAARE